MIARLLLTGVFLFLWLPLASLMLDNISFAPPLAQAKLFGPLPWQSESRALVQDSRQLPAFVVYGHTADKSAVALKTGLFRWSADLSASEPLFATDQPSRPFVAQGDIDRDAGLKIHIAHARVNLLFFLWALLSGAAPVLFWFWLTADPGRVLSPQERWRRDEDFRQKVRDIEVDYAERSAALRLHTVLLAFLGYGVLFGSVLLLAAGGLGLAVVGFALTQSRIFAALAGLVPLAFAFRLFRSLVHPRYASAGARLKPDEAPALFALLDKIHRKTNGPLWRRVFVAGVLNASVSRSTGPLGFFGFGPVTLNLGLPLMQALSPAQLEAVLGHEYGHVAARDNAFAQWVYRIRNSWLDLGEQLKTEPLWHLLRLNLFYQWFLGSFRAYSFVLSRLCEYEADAFAGRVAGRGQSAEALVALHLNALRLERDYWRAVWKKADTAPEPQGAPFTGLARFFREPFEAKALKEELKVLEKEKTGFASTHPATVQRVRALGEEVAAPPPPGGNAAEALLGERLARELAAAFDRSWRKSSAKSWHERHAQYQKAHKRREELQRRDVERLGRRELDDLVAAAAVLEDDKSALAAWDEIAAREPANVAAVIHRLGYRLTVKHDEAALVKLEEILRENPGFLSPVSRYVLRHFRRLGRLEEAEVWQFRLDEWEYQSQEAAEIFPTDTFRPHQLKADELKKITACFSKHPAVGRIYVVSKPLVYLKGYMMTVIGLRRSLWLLNFPRANRELRELIAKAPLRRQYHIVLLNDMHGVESKLKKVEGAVVYEK